MNQFVLEKVHEFGRILPLLYLKDILDRQKCADKAVPRLFIIPNASKTVSFEFFMPYLDQEQTTMRMDVANNLLQVTSDSFTIYQEYIDGEYIIGDKSFACYGHCDFNAKQIVKSSKDEKKYLAITMSFFKSDVSNI